MVSGLVALMVACNNDTSSSNIAVNPPYIESIQPLKLVSTQRTEVMIVAGDKDGDTLHYSLIDAPSWVTIEQDGRLILTPSLEDIGHYQFLIQVSDGKLLASTAVVSDVSRPMTPIDPDLVNHAPTLETINSITLVGTKRTEIQVNASDQDGDDLSYFIENAPNWMSIQHDGLLTFTPTLADVGHYDVTVAVSDGVLWSKMTIQLNVVIPMTPIDPDLVNHAPTLETISSITLVGSKRTEIQVNASDQDGDDLSYFIENAPDWMSIQHDGVLTFTPSLADVGRYAITVAVSDGMLWSKMTVQLNVVIPMTPIDPDLVNHAPTLEKINSITLVGSKRTEIQVNASDQDGDDLSYFIENAPNWISIQHDGLLTFTPTLADVGHYDVTVAVSDGVLWSKMTIQLNVVIPMTPIDPDLVNHAPVISPIRSFSLDDETVTSYQVQASDVDNDALSYQLIGAPNWAAISDSGMLSLKPTRADKGEFSFEVSVSDGSMSANAKINVSVTLVNRAPVIESIASQTVNELEAVAIQVQATDDQPTSIFFKLINPPAWANITSTGYLTLMPSRDDEGEYSLVVEASDGELSSKTTFNVIVTISNLPPIISEMVLPDAIIGDEYYYEVIASDNDNDQLSYSLLHGPSWMEVDAETGVISGTVSEESYGAISITVSVTDGELMTEATSKLETVSQTEIHKFIDSYSYDFDVVMGLPKISTRLVTVSEVQEVSKENTVTFTDIQFMLENDQWYIFNNTMLPIGELTVRTSGESDIVLFNFSSNVMPYTKAKLDINLQDFTTLEYVNFKKMYLPTMSLGGDKSCENSQEGKTCYESPELGSERQTYERTLAFIYDSFNRPSFIRNVQTFFKDKCNDYAPCVTYTQNNPEDLDYGYRNYLTIGQEGHQLSMLVMRKIYAAEGMGGGVTPSISDIRDWGGHGWASIWAEYIDNTSDAYRPLPMNTLFHEIAHANGYGHDSGWTYGFSENFEWTYLPTTNQDLTKTPILRMPEIIPKVTITPYNIHLEVLSKHGMEKSNVHFKVASSKRIDFTAKYENLSSKNVIDLSFSTLPNAPIYIHIWDEDSTYMSTLKVDAFMLAKSLDYLIDGVSYKVIDPRIVPDDANGWSVKDVCRRPKNIYHVATKVEYQGLFDYMYSNGIVNELDELNQSGQPPLRSFLSSDEPQSYYIWNVYFEEQRMNAWYFVMTSQVESYRSVVCVH